MAKKAKNLRLDQGRRIVIKVGSQLVVSEKSDHIRRAWIASMAEDIAQIRAQGHTCLLVTSGAVAIGCRVMGLDRRRLRLDEQQAVAAIGQGYLFDAWRRAFLRHKIVVAQILLTLDDTEQRRRYLNARETLAALHRKHVHPIINENDTVATDEIRFGDNDRLAARVAQVVGADTLVLLSHVDGLYSADPTEDSTARHIPQIDALTPDILAMAGTKTSYQGSGGMATKLEAARIAMAAGCRMVIADGRGLNPLRRMDHEETRSSWFLPGSSPLTIHKQWIAGSLSICGSVMVDAGAAVALNKGKSLLPAGVSEVRGAFERGDAVYIRCGDNTVLGRGLVAWSAMDARRIIGQKSGEIARILGYSGRRVMIHRNDMVLE